MTLDAKEVPVSPDRTANATIPITLIPGDGIGPECVEAAQRILEAAGAPIVLKDFVRYALGEGIEKPPEEA